MIAPTRADDEALARARRRGCESPSERLADLRAQRAANLTGARRVAELVERHGAGGLAGGDGRDPRLLRAPHPRGDRRAARRRLRGRRRARGRPASGELELRVAADDRRRLARARLRRAPAEQVEGNLNCPLSVTKSAAFFAVRVLTDPDGPPSRRRPPAGARRSPRRARCSTRGPRPRSPRGNVETSSRVADLVLAAFAGATEVPAQGQGTMNNLTLAGDGVDLLRDDRRRPGRLPGRRRARARSTWRCRTRSTPRSRRWRPSTRCACASSRCGAARAAPGARRGGDGIVREIEALEPMRFTPDHRAPRGRPPRGREGGADGAPGRNLLNGEPNCPRNARATLAAGRPAADRDARWRRATERPAG